MERVLSWVLAVPRFLYHFIVGDDWTMAVAVFIGLVLSAILNADHLVAWWLIPVIVVVMLGISLRRASGTRR
jgi:large-conductance mechanosensitive channel